MEFIWHDGGRADSGYVGLTGDCVTRAIAIATGINYRDVYRSLADAAESSPRNGVINTIAANYLSQLGWQYTTGHSRQFGAYSLPKGAVIVHIKMPHRQRGGHFCAVVDHVIYDTWNASDDEEYIILGYWTRPAIPGHTTLPKVIREPRQNSEELLTQKEFDKVLHLLRSLDNTANNSASTEGEKRNALRMMQNLLLRHNLSRADIAEDDNVESMRFTRMACAVNGSRACRWEKNLAAYLVAEIFPMTGWYFGIKGHRTLFWFYGPVDDVRNCIALFRELLLTIATSAHLQYRGHSRGSGASYAEGYVRGLPRRASNQYDAAAKETALVSESALITARSLAVSKAIKDWLYFECGVSLTTSRGTGRYQNDPAAANRGVQHGSKHDLTAASGRKRIGYSPS